MACPPPEQLITLPLITASVVGRQPLRAATGRASGTRWLLAPTPISDHYPFLRQGILAGLGLGLVPDYVVQDVVASGAVVTALDDFQLSIFGTRMYLLHLPGRHQTRRCAPASTFCWRAAGQSAPPTPGEPPA